MRPSSGCSGIGYRRLLLSLLVLVSIADGSLATIDNATGAVRENSLPRPDPSGVLSSVDPSILNEADKSTTAISAAGVDATTTTTPKTASSTAAQMVSSATTRAATTTTTTPPTAAQTGRESTTAATTEAPVVPTEVSPSAKHDARPSSCSEFNASTIQLVYSEKARIRKCCPPGQMIRPRNDYQYECVPGSRELKIDTVEAHFYGNNECIEVSEEKPSIPVEAHDQCQDVRDALMYSADQGDEMFVLQNGSLLVLEYGSLVSVFDSYCVEMTSDARLLAKVCEHLPPKCVWTRRLIVAGVTLAMVLLLLTALCYSFVPRLNDTFGYLIAGHAGTFAIGTIFLGLARCGDCCISSGGIGVTEMFANALLGSSVFVFFLMNVFNALYVAYYIPNGLEYDSKNKREMYAFLAVLYTITLIPLFLLPKGGLISMVFMYFGAILITHALSHYYTRRLTSGIYLHINDTTSRETKINHARLNDISQQKCLCLMETAFSLACWILFAVLTLTYSMSDVAQVATVYSVALQGMFIGVVFVGGRQRWTIIRECWSNSGSVDLRAVENGIEMKPLQRKAQPAEGETND